MWVLPVITPSWRRSVATSGPSRSQRWAGRRRLDPAKQGSLVRPGEFRTLIPARQSACSSTPTVVRNGLAPGGRWIRTIGPCREGAGLYEPSQDRAPLVSSWQLGGWVVSRTRISDDLAPLASQAWR